MSKKMKFVYTLLFIVILFTLFKISYNTGKLEGLKISTTDYKEAYIQGFNDAIETYEYNK